MKRSLGLASLAFAAASLCSGAAAAQQVGYTADRLILAPNPDDGFATPRPVMHERTRFFGSFTGDYINRPLHITDITSNGAVQQTEGAPVARQVNGYFTAGAEILRRFSLSMTLPVTLLNSTNNPSGRINSQTNDPTRSMASGIQSRKSAPGDLRLDGRVILYTSDSKRFAWGMNATYFLPTGNELSFAGDAGGHALLQTTFEEKVGPFILDQTFGVHMRERHRVAELSFANELTFGFALFLPLRGGRVRVGGELYGQTGLSKSERIGTLEGQSTTFKRRYTPIEWLGEVRVALGEEQKVWASGGAGTLVVPGYSAPDFRVIAQIGGWWDLKNTAPTSPGRKFTKDDDRVEEHGADRDKDGIPDAIDACPDVPEDKQPPDPNDGCPLPPDRDKDGIPDKDDKCPDVPEDKDGIDDTDGCPEDDVDGDGIPDVKDACPREPGQPSKDPKQNGCPQFIRRVEGSSEIQILKKIEFDTGKATIKPVSFPILDEITQLLKATPSIKKVSIEGHTDSRGAKDMNMRLSDDRSKSVLKYLVEHGIAADRLTAQGFGPEKPIDTNDTDAGRQKNRRVEFHIVELARDFTRFAVLGPPLARREGGAAFGAPHVLGILAVIVFIVLNGSLVAAEFALVKLRATHQPGRQVREDDLVAQAVARIDRFLSVTQLGITLASLGLGWVGEPAVVHLFEGMLGASPPAWAKVTLSVAAFTLLTFAHVLFGELVPKLLAIQRSRQIAELSVWPLRVGYYAMWPFLAVLEGSSRLILGLFGMRMDAHAEAQLSEEEILGILTLHVARGQGAVDKQEIVRRMLRFAGRTAKQVMVPRVDVASLPVGSDGRRAAEQFSRQGYSRMPLTNGAALDEVVGYVYVKDFFRAPHNLELSSLEGLRREVLFVPETQELVNVLRAMQHANTPLAMVVDEYGGVSGLITMEDLLEEIVGEIRDELDVEIKRIERRADDVFDVDGGVLLDELVAEGLDVGEHDEGETISASVLAALGRIPRRGDVVDLGRVRAEVLLVVRRRIVRVKVSRIPAANAP
ncbi:MAG: DUF21 domain-containing protein [Polyangiaceae bacterium]|nr:DUF21 domain-containing protein [Polyangiaceae bacterium]